MTQNAGQPEVGGRKKAGSHPSQRYGLPAR